MRAFLIDPFKQEVTEINYSGDFHQIYDLIDAETFDVARLNANGDGIYVDDEGLYAEDVRFFQHRFYPQPLAGKGLVLGCDMETGESAPASMTLAQLVDDIEWVMPIRVNGEVTWISA
jgi:hypothetical protein